MNLLKVQAWIIIRIEGTSIKLSISAVLHGTCGKTRGEISQGITAFTALRASTLPHPDE